MSASGPDRTAGPVADQATGLNTQILLEFAKRALGGMSLEQLLEALLNSARQLTGAAYAAVGVLEQEHGDSADASRRFAQFRVAGVDARTAAAIGGLPKGHGVLGALIDDPRALRLTDIGSHPQSYGFPAAHPPMSTFLGVPLFVEARPFASIYLSEKADSEPFTAQDEHAVVTLAEIAGLAIAVARRESAERERGDQLQRKVSALEVTSQITRAVGGRTDLRVILELVAKRGRAVVDARVLLIKIEDGADLVVVAGVGEMPEGILGRRLAMGGTVAEQALRTRLPQRLSDTGNRVRFQEHGLGAVGLQADDGLVIPLVFLDRTYGVLVAVDRLHDGPEFSVEDVRLLEAFAASAATALATGTAVASDMQRLAAVIESSSDAIVTVDREGLITTWNAGAEALYGLSVEQMMGRRATDAMPGLSEFELEHGALERVLSGETITTHEIHGEHADGSMLELSLSASPIRDLHGRVTGAASITRDVGRQNEMQRVLVQGQRLDSIGALARGVAHDMNNVLGVIITHADFAIEQMETGAAAEEVREIRRAADGAAVLMRQLLQFARRSTYVEPVRLELSVSVKAMTKMLDRIIGEQIELIVDLGPSLWISADPAQVEQVIMSLALNARDAMPEGGSLTITISEPTAEQNAHGTARAPAGGRHVCLTVADTGTGMEPEALAKAFEPFYTTKPAGDGSGMGLAIVYDSVTRAGGRVEIDSVAENGTVVSVLWRFAEPPAGPGRGRSAPSGMFAQATRALVILLVEDEGALRRITARLLRAAGYIVLEAARAGEAIEIAAHEDQQIDLLLTDVVMPGMSGAALAQRLQQTRPALSVLYTSGYLAHPEDLPEGAAFVRKPFTRSGLLDAVESARTPDAAVTAPPG